MSKNTFTKRIVLFLFGCIVLRSYFVYVAKTVDPTTLSYLAFPALCVSFGLFYFFFSGTRTTGPETFGEEIWWNRLRPVHGTLYLLFALCALSSTYNQYAFLFLLLDVIIGLGAFFLKHFSPIL